MSKRQHLFPIISLRVIMLVGFFIGLIGLSIFLLANPQIIENLPANLQNWIKDAGPLGWVLIITLMILHSFVPLPSELVALAAGMSYGVLLASILVWIGAMLGAIIAFAIARWLGEPVVARILNPSYLEKLEQWKLNQGIPTLLVSRLIPVISFNLINYAAGLAGVPWWPFLWTTAIGIIPMTLLSVFVGASMGTLPLGWIIFLSVAGIFLVFLVHLWFRMHHRAK